LDHGAQRTRIAADHPTITKAWVDTGYKTQAIEHGAALGIDVDVVPRNAQVKGFSVIPRRWVVEGVRREALVDRVEVRDLHQLAVAAAVLKLRAA
jgi:transposase